MKRAELTVGDVVQVRAERLAFGGDAVAHHDGIVVFIPFAAPDDLLLVRIIERKARFARAAIEQVLEPSTSRRQPPCAHFGVCGGCQLQHLSYPAQLAAKAAFVRDALQRIGGIDWPKPIPVRAGDELGYRQRARLSVDRSRHPAAIGWRRARSREVCAVQQCPILVPELEQAIVALRDAAARGAALPDEIELIAGDGRVAAAPAVAGLVAGAVENRVAGATFEASAATFFQGHRQLLVELVEHAVEGQGGNLAFDLYAGAGLFSVHLARRFARVDAIETDPAAVRSGRHNVARNGAVNVRFHQSEVAAWLHQRAEPAVDLVLLDPPRGGARAALPPLVALAPRRIVYVSCDPASLARDLRTLDDAGYRISDLVAFDMFPQTYHVEAVARLEGP